MTILVSTASSVVSILSSVTITWYFSKRHYTRTPRPPVTDNDTILQNSKNEFHAAVLAAVLVILVLSLMILFVVLPIIVLDVLTS